MGLVKYFAANNEKLVRKATVQGSAHQCVNNKATKMEKIYKYINYMQL